MTRFNPSTGRRAALRSLGGIFVAGGLPLMLPGCGRMPGGETSVTPTGLAGAAGALPAAAEAPVDPLNLGLLIDYVGGEYFAFGASGAGLPGGGAVIGARRATLADPLVSALAADIATDKAAAITRLRDALGAAAAPAPAIDFSNGAESPFGRIGRAAGLGAAGAAFDPFADDRQFLLGAFVLQDVAAAAYRSLASAGATDATRAAIEANLADATYHGGLIRALLADRAAKDPELAGQIKALAELMARLGGPVSADADPIDGDGLPIPFERSPAEVLAILSAPQTGVSAPFARIAA